MEAIGQNYRKGQKRQHAARQAEKFGQLAEYSFDPENKKRYEIRAGEWKGETGPKTKAADITGAHERFVGQLRNDDSPSRHKSMLALDSEMTEMAEDLELHAPFAYMPDSDAIKYNPKAPHFGDYDLDYAFAHETSHRMDVLEYHSWANEKFRQSIEICA